MNLAERLGDHRRLMVPTILLVVVALLGVLAPGNVGFIGSTWAAVAITAAVQGLIALSAGMLFGRAGLLSLCAVSFVGISAWVNAWLVVHASLPFFVNVLIGAIAVIPFGILVGGLAVRLRGVNLAIVTLTFAAAVVGVFGSHKFPGSQDDKNRGARPIGFQSDRMYFLLCFMVLVACGLALEWYGRRRNGLAWRAVRSSERATAGAGLSVPMVKVNAFVVSAVLAGIAGGLFMGQYKGSISEATFLPVASMVLVASAVMVGAQSLSGAVLAGLLASVIPEIFDRNGWATEYPQILFGLGAIQALSQGGGGISAGFPWRRPQHSTRPTPEPPPEVAATAIAAGGAAILDIRNLTVRYGALTALSEVNVKVPAQTVVGVIGPNGAGKSTLVDAVCGFVTNYNGDVVLNGRPFDAMSATNRARAGLRRTFQQGRAIPELTVGQYINLSVAKPLPADELEQLLGFFQLPPADEPISLIDVGTRRILEVAASLASRPQVVFLDEPAAGLGAEQSALLGQHIKEIPARFGCSVLLIEHNVELVAEVCSEITVIDFGVVIAHGTPNEVLSNPIVARAYLGEEIEHEVGVDVEGALQ